MMARERLLRRRTMTAPPTGILSGSEAGQRMPRAMVEQTWWRGSAMGLVAAGLWAMSLIMNAVVAPMLGRRAVFEGLWSYPSLPVGLTGISLSGLLVLLAARLSHRPRLLIDLSAGFLILMCSALDGLTLERAIGSGWTL